MTQVGFTPQRAGLKARGVAPEERYFAARRSIIVATHSPMIVEPASDWLVRTCNASLGLAAAAGRGAASAVAALAALSWQLRQAAESLALRLAGESSTSTHPSFPHSHTHFPAPCAGVGEAPSADKD